MNRRDGIPDWRISGSCERNGSSGRPGRRLSGVALAALLLAAGVGLLGRDAYLEAKGWLAGRMIDEALVTHLADGRPHPPWSWADFAPVARLDVPRLGVRRAVLSGAAGESLAFGLGHIDGTARPGGGGNCVLAGHRDSWAAFLGDLRAGDEILIESFAGRDCFVVACTRIVDRRDLSPLEPGDGERLTLVTCYPFRGLTPGDERYVVECLATGANRPVCNTTAGGS